MNPRRFVLLLASLLFLPSAGWLAFNSVTVQSRIFGYLVSEDTYLANLRDPQLGCRSLPFRRAAIVLIGDSHSYAGWDFKEVQEKSGLRAGACALGGLYLDSVPLLIDYVVKSSPDADVVVLGLSPRMFWESAEKQEQVDHHAKVIPALLPDARPFLRRRLGLEALPYDGESIAAERHRERIEALDEASVDARLQESRGSIRTLREWDRRLRESTFSGASRALSARICSQLRVAGLRLWLVHLPESRDLESRYDGGIWDAYRQSTAGLAACADKVVIEKGTTFGLGNRHYVNRYLRDDHDYGMWGRAAPLAEDSAFDADHMNPIGAALFTRAMIGRLAGN